MNEYTIMAGYSQNLKVNVGADTSGFDAGMKKAKAELRDFQKTGKDTLSSLGNMLGVDTGKVQQFTNALQGLGAKMDQTGKRLVIQAASAGNQTNAFYAVSVTVFGDAQGFFVREQAPGFCQHAQGSAVFQAGGVCFQHFFRFDQAG